MNVYLATQPISRSLLSCGARLFVTLYIETANFTIKLFHRLVAPSFYTVSHKNVPLFW